AEVNAAMDRRVLVMVFLLSVDRRNGAGWASASVRLRGSARGGGSSGPPMQGLDPDQPRVLVDAGGDGQPVDLAEDIGGEDVLAGADRADAAPIEQDHVVGHRGRMSEIVEDDAD